MRVRNSFPGQGTSRIVVPTGVTVSSMGFFIFQIVFCFEDFCEIVFLEILSLLDGTLDFESDSGLKIASSAFFYKNG